MTTTSKSRRRSVSKIISTVLTGLLVFLIAAGGGYFGYQRFVPRATTVVPTTTRSTRGSISQVVTSSGTTVATTQAALGFANTSGSTSSGKLLSLSVAVGDDVVAGQELARLDTRTLETTLLQQKAGLASAQAALSKTLAGATDSDLTAARASVVSAQAAVTKAQNDLTALQRPKNSDELASAAAALEKARAALQTAQTAYDQVAWRNDAGSTSAAVTLQTATADYNSALAAYNIAVAPPKDTDVANAQLVVNTANSNLDSAQAKLNSLLAGPLPQDVASSQASVDSAAAQLANAQLNLDQAVLKAPFNGRISTITNAPGETVTGNFITLVDTSRMRVDVSVDETDVAKVKTGQNVNVTLTAFGGLVLTGTVSSVSPVATIVSGVSTFPVRIALNTNGQTVLSGLNASVAIVIATKTNVVLVATRALQQTGQTRSVRVEQPDGTIVTRPVQTGLSDDTQTEIVSGLQEGETVVIPTTTTSTGAANPRPGAGFPGGGGGVFIAPGGR